jgi:hypothetical protein
MSIMDAAKGKNICPTTLYAKEDLAKGRDKNFFPRLGTIRHDYSGKPSMIGSAKRAPRALRRLDQP